MSSLLSKSLVLFVFLTLPGSNGKASFDVRFVPGNVDYLIDNEAYSGRVNTYEVRVQLLRPPRHYSRDMVRRCTAQRTE